MKTKFCLKCKEVKDIIHFTKDKNVKDGLCIYCKTCSHIMGKQYRLTSKEERRRYDKKKYIKNKDKIIDRVQQYFKTTKGKESNSQASKKYRKTLKGKNAIKRGIANHRKLGRKLINKWFEGAIEHHDTDKEVYFIHKDVHLYCYVGTNRELHRQKVRDFFGGVENMKNWAKFWHTQG